jgi:uncharacterized protein (DUF983 family)
MIEKIYKKERMAICDNCGEGQVCDSWAEVIDFMNEEGWRKKLVGGEWKHYCPECQEGLKWRGRGLLHLK